MNIINKHSMLKVIVLSLLFIISRSDAAQPAVETPTSEGVPCTALIYSKFAADSGRQIIRMVFAAVSRSLAFQKPQINRNAEKVKMSGVKAWVIACNLCYQVMQDYDRIELPCMCAFHIDCGKRILIDSMEGTAQDDIHFTCPKCVQDITKCQIEDEPGEEPGKGCHPIIFTRGMMLKEISLAEKERAKVKLLENRIKKVPEELLAKSKKSNDSCVIS
jgi:hypothetical protein